ncbi:MAG: hypothetical protein AAB638_01895, partial [Patescibacteria group bacterium]
TLLNRNGSFEEVTSPDDLDLNDTEVIEANKLFVEWAKPDTPEGDSGRHNFEKTKFYVDVGFTDPEYLKDVLEWLREDIKESGVDPDNLEQVKFQQEQLGEIDRVRELIAKTEGADSL